MFSLSIVLFLCLSANWVSAGHPGLGKKRRGAEQCQEKLNTTSKSMDKSLQELNTLISRCGSNDGKYECGCYTDHALKYTNHVIQSLDEIQQEKEDEECPICPNPDLDSNEELDSNQKAMDCSELYQKGKHKSGVYTIYPKTRTHKGSGITVYCDMETDEGGWTVIQRRGRYSEETNFYRNWAEYKKGFGNVSRDFWLGNENIHALTNQGVYSLRIDLTSHTETTKYSLHETFWIEDEHSNYILHVSDFSGTSTNGMQIHDKMPFSTFDKANDKKPDTLHCPVIHRGAWWYPIGGCGYANLNGVYMDGIHDVKANWWYLGYGFNGLKHSEMKIRHVYPHLSKDM